MIHPLLNSRAPKKPAWTLRLACVPQVPRMPRATKSFSQENRWQNMSRIELRNEGHQDSNGLYSKTTFASEYA